MTVTVWTVSDLPHTRRALRALALRLVADPEAADDVVQDACLALVERGELPAAPASWLTRVTRNLALRWRRDAARRRRREAVSARAEGVPDAPTLAVQVELQRDLADAVLALDEPYRSTLLQRFWEDKTPSAIAAATGAPVATVKARLQRGLAQVRTALDRRYGDRAAWRAALLPMLRRGTTLAAAGLSGSVWWGIAAAGVAAIGLGVRWVASQGGESATTAAGEVAATSVDRGAREASPVAPATPSAHSSTAATRTPVADTSEHLLVEVIGVDGAPAADIGVGVRGLQYDRGGGNWWEYSRSLGRTDAGGRLRSDAVPADEAWWRELSDPHVRVYVDEPGLVDLATEPMTRAELHRAHVRLKMPATGRLRVVPTDAVGRPIVHANASVTVAEDPPSPDATRERPRRQASWTKRCARGEAVFPVVGLGVRFSLTNNWANGTAGEPLSVPNEERTILFGHRPDWPIVAGRLLDDAGQPIASTEFDVRAILGQRISMPNGITLADGRFAVAIARAEDVRLVLSDLSLGIGDRMAHPPLRGPLEARVYELGDVVLRPWPPIVAGRVLLPEAARTSLDLHIERLQHVKYLDGSEKDVWQRVERTSLRRNGGDFSFTGEVAPGRLRVTAISVGLPLLPPEPVEFPLGASAVLLQFRAGGVLKVTFPGEIPERALHAWLEPAPGVVPAFASGGGRLAAMGGNQLAWPSLWPGRYRLLAQVRGDATPAVTLDAVDIADGQTTTLGPLPLPSPIRQLTVRIVDEAGKPLRHSALVVHPARGEDASVLFAAEGEANVPLTAASVDVVVAAGGKRAARVRLDADTTVRLAPAGKRALLVVGGMPALPQDVELALEVHAEATDTRLREQYDQVRAACAGLVGRRRVQLDGDGRGEVELAQAGRYRVVPVLLTLKTRFSYRVEIGGAAVELMVGESDFASPPTSAPLAVVLPEPGLGAALARVRELLPR